MAEDVRITNVVQVVISDNFEDVVTNVSQEVLFSVLRNNVSNVVQVILYKSGEEELYGAII